MWRTLTEILHHYAHQYPDNLFTRFLEQGNVTETFTYAQMWAYANRWADGLLEVGLVPGDRVVIALGNTSAFVGAYYGTLLVGGLPVPVAPLRNRSVDDHDWQRIAGQVHTVAARVLVVPGEQVDGRRLLPIVDGQRPTLLTSAHLTGRGHSPLEPSHDKEATALLQFTSGTSGTAKVVQLSHAALIHQIEAISEALALVDPDEDWAVSWLPMFHDMGLIGFLLTPTLRAGHVSLLRTEDFMQRPRLWFQALSDFGATITGGPPSSYVLCARFLKDDEIKNLDLSRLRVALVGAESVTRNALDIVAERFAPSGLRRSSLIPTYGLAENGLAVTMPPLGGEPIWDEIDLRYLQQTGTAQPSRAGSALTRRFVSVGHPIKRTKLKIVDDADCELGERQIGEICIHGPSLMEGYYNQPHETAAALRQGWLYTGDTGYVADSELYVVGRKKELLIIGGQNYTPDDIEQAVVAASSTTLRRVVAVSCEDTQRATEKLVVLVETALKDAAGRVELRRTIRQSLVHRGFPAAEVILIRPKTIEVTDTGKVKRADAKARYLAGEFDEN